MTEQHTETVELTIHINAKYADIKSIKTQFGSKGRGESKKAEGEKRDLFYAELIFESWDQIVEKAIGRVNIDNAKKAGEGKWPSPANVVKYIPVEVVSGRKGGAVKKSIEAQIASLSAANPNQKERLLAIQKLIAEQIALAEMMADDDEDNDEFADDEEEEKPAPKPAPKAPVKAKSKK